MRRSQTIANSLVWGSEWFSFPLRPNAEAVYFQKANNFALSHHKAKEPHDKGGIERTVGLV